MRMRNRHALRSFRRQGELWRALLSGEKKATEMLEPENYVKTARDSQHKCGVTCAASRYSLASLQPFSREASLYTSSACDTDATSGLRRLRRWRGDTTS